MNSDNLKINPKLAGGVGVGAHVGILLVWVLKTYLDVPLGEPEIASIIALCSFGTGWLVR